jgi:UDP-N-acetylmuramoyl-tripeptide--D-alanyl-D-alanine ligase
VEFTVNEIGAVIGVRAASDARITGWSVDSRTIAPGDLFFALRGPNHDGNAYVDGALRKGAVAAVVDQKQNMPENDPSLMVVADSLVAAPDLVRTAANRTQLP